MLGGIPVWEEKKGSTIPSANSHQSQRGKSQKQSTLNTNQVIYLRFKAVLHFESAPMVILSTNFTPKCPIVVLGTSCILKTGVYGVGGYSTGIYINGQKDISSKDIDNPHTSALTIKNLFMGPELERPIGSRLLR